MVVKGIIFDKDGTLLDFDGYWLPVTRCVLEDLLKEIKREDIPQKELLCAVGVMDGKAEISGSLCCGTYGMVGCDIYSVLSRYGVKITLQETVDLTIKYFHEHANKGIMNPTSPSLKATLVALKEQGIKLAVVTSDDKFVTLKCLETLGIKDLFDDIFADDGAHPPKPDPYYANEFMKKYGFSQAETLMVGDTFTDVNFAKNAKIGCVAIAKTLHNRALLEKEVPNVISDMQELLGVLGL